MIRHFVRVARFEVKKVKKSAAEKPRRLKSLKLVSDVGQQGDLTGALDGGGQVVRRGRILPRSDR